VSPKSHFRRMIDDRLGSRLNRRRSVRTAERLCPYAVSGMPPESKNAASFGSYRNRSLHFSLRLLILMCPILLAACGGGYHPPITISLSPAPSTVVTSATAQFTAYVSNDPTNAGINWSASCSAAKCGSVSPAKTTSGMPTTYASPSGVSADLSVTLTASSVTDSTKSVSIPITVVPPLSVTTLSLPNATGGIAYNQALQAAGGLPPYTWSLSAGSTVPAGLVLDSNGTIAGSPTAGGNFNFSVQVADSGNPQLTAPATLSMTVTILPLTVSTTSLPNGTVDTSYLQSLQATGGVPPYTWSISSGSLPPWVSFDAQGVLQGFPNSAASTSFTVLVTDAETPAAKTAQPLSITVTTGTGANDSRLKGHYAFLFSGFDDATGSPVAVTGSLTADGAGNLINGLEDINGPGAPSLNVPFTGTYNIGADDRGAFTIVTSSDTRTYVCVIGAVKTGVANNGRLIEFDDTDGKTGRRGSGILRLQDTTAFSLASITGPYAFGLGGSDASGSRGAMVGRFTADGKGSLPSGIADENVAGTATNPSLTGSYTAPSMSNGRGVLTLNPSGAANWNFAVYIVSANELLAMTTDVLSSAGLHSGSILSQKSTAFSSQSFNAPAILYDSGVDTSTPPKANAELGILTPDGNGTVLATLDQNTAGAISQQVSFTGAYSVTPIGRVIINNWRANNTSPLRLLYLVDTNKAFFLDSSSAVGFGFVEPQATPPAGGYVDASLSSAFLSGTSTPTLSTLPNASGQGLLDGTTNFSETVDASSSTGLTVGKTTTGTYSISGNGRGTVTSLKTSGILGVLFLTILALLILVLCAPKLAHRTAPRPVFAMLLLLAVILASVAGCILPKPELVFYVISPTKFVLIDLSKSNTTPTVAIFEQ
jgi:large repetitive protein